MYNYIEYITIHFALFTIHSYIFYMHIGVFIRRGRTMRVRTHAFRFFVSMFHPQPSIWSIAIISFFILHTGIPIRGKNLICNIYYVIYRETG